MKVRTPKAKSRWYRKPWVVAVAAALALLSVVILVFAVSSLARDVSRWSQRSHTNTEIQRVTASVQTQLTVAESFRQLGEGVDTSVVQQDSQRVVVAGLESLNRAADEPDMTADVQGELRRYIDIAQSHLLAPDGEMDLAATEVAFQELSGVLDSAQDSIEKELVAANSRMNSVASIAGFIIAFVVPGAGLAAWELLRRFRDRQVTLENEVARLREQRRTVVDELASGMSDVRRQTTQMVETLSQNCDEYEDAEVLEQSRQLAKSVQRLDASTRTKAPMNTSVRSDIALAESLREAAAADNFPYLILPSPDRLEPEATVFADGDLLHSFFVELFRFAAISGEKVQVDADATPDQIEVTVRHGGTVAPEVASMVYRGDNPRHRELAPIESRPQDLLNIRYLVEAAGGSMSLAQEDGESIHIVTLAATGPTATQGAKAKDASEGSEVSDVLAPAGSVGSLGS